MDNQGAPVRDADEGGDHRPLTCSTHIAHRQRQRLDGRVTTLIITTASGDKEVVAVKGHSSASAARVHGWETAPGCLPSAARGHGGSAVTPVATSRGSFFFSPACRPTKALHRHGGSIIRPKATNHNDVAVRERSR